jgi:hypothetical protein
MPGAATPSFPTHDDDADEDYVGDSEVPESIPLVLPSELEPARRDAVCLHTLGVRGDVLTQYIASTLLVLGR